MPIQPKPLTSMTPQQAAQQGYSYSGAVGYYKENKPPTLNFKNPEILKMQLNPQSIDYSRTKPAAASSQSQKNSNSITPPATIQEQAQTSTTSDTTAKKPTAPDYLKPEQLNPQSRAPELPPKHVAPNKKTYSYFDRPDTPRNIDQAVEKGKRVIKEFEEKHIDPLAPIMQTVTQTKTQTGAGRDVKIIETRESKFLETKTPAGNIRSFVYGGYQGLKGLVKIPTQIWTAGKSAGTATAKAQQTATEKAKTALETKPDFEKLKSAIGEVKKADQQKIQKKMYSFSQAVKNFDVNEKEWYYQKSKKELQVIEAEMKLLETDTGHISRFVGNVVGTSVAINVAAQGLSAAGRIVTKTPKMVKVNITKQITRETSRDTTKMIDKPGRYNKQPPSQIKISTETITTTEQEAKKMIAQSKKPDAFAIIKTAYTQRGYTQKEAADTFQYSRLSYIQKATPQTIKELSKPAAHNLKALTEAKKNIAKELNAIKPETQTRKLYFHTTHGNVGDQITKLADDLKAEIKQTTGAKLSGTTKIIKYQKDVFKHDAQHIPNTLLYEKDNILPLKRIKPAPIDDPTDDPFKIIRPDPDFKGTPFQFDAPKPAPKIIEEQYRYNIGRNSIQKLQTSQKQRMIPKSDYEYTDMIIASPHTTTIEETANAAMQKTTTGTGVAAIIRTDLKQIQTSQKQYPALTLTALKPKIDIENKPFIFAELKPVVIEMEKQALKQVLKPATTQKQALKQATTQKYKQKLKTDPVQSYEFKPVKIGRPPKPIKTETLQPKITPYISIKNRQTIGGTTKTGHYIGFKPVFVNKKGYEIKKGITPTFTKKKYAVKYAATVSLKSKLITGFKIKEHQTKYRPIKKEARITKDLVKKEFRKISGFYIERSKLRTASRKNKMKWF